MMEDEINVLDMSDDDFAKKENDIPLEVVPEVVEDKPLEEEDETKEETPAEEILETKESIETTEETEETEDPVDPEEETKTGDIEKEEKEETEAPVEKKVPDSLNYEEIGKELFKPFKSNGNQVQVRNEKDIKKLMSLGASYTQRMQELAPNLTKVKMLENANLLDDEKLAYLIDLSEGNPEAIKKLLTTLPEGVDLLDLTSELETGQEYKPTDRSVSAQSMAMDNALKDLESNSANYAKTLDVVGNDWDDSSRNTITEKPELLAIIDSHIESGFFDEVNAVLNNNKLFEDPSNLSSIEDYFAVALQLETAKTAQANNTKKATPAPKPKAKPNKVAIDPVGSASSLEGVDVLSMSDEEFDKMNFDF